MFLSIIGIIVFWIIAGFVINFLFYYNVPKELHGKNETAKGVHATLNVITIIILIFAFFS